MIKISRLALMRRKSLFKTAKAAWKEISSNIDIKPSQVIASHTQKAWMWTPKKNSGFIFLKPGTLKGKTKKQIKKAIKKITKENKSKGKITVKTSRKDFDMCKNIDNALKNPNVSKIIIQK